MEEERKMYPSLPSNYVSLVQLQERWLKQQQQEQREKEEQPRPGENLGQERNRQDEEIRRRNQNGERTEPSSVSVISRPPYRRKGRNQSQRDFQTIEMSKPKLDESAVEGVDREQKADESKKKTTKWKKNGRPRADEDQTIGVFLRLTPEAEPQEEIPVVVAEINGEKESIRSKFPQNGNNQGLSRKVWEPKVPGDQTAEIERSFERLSLNGGKEASGSSIPEMNGGQWGHGGSGRFGRREVWKQKACNLVWMKKSAISDANVAEIRSSGPLVKAREDKKKNQRQLKQKEINWRE